MDEQLFQPLSGFRDVLGPTKDRLLSVAKNTFQSYGYQGLETPALERQEILLGKFGEEAQKLLYLFNDNGDRQVGLRYDLTVPLARYVALNRGKLILPFKRYEIGPVWRAERPQKGRYRQFAQADIDIVGVANITAERELLEIVRTIEQKLELKFTYLLNDRRLVAQALEKIQVGPDLQPGLLRLLDKKDKLSSEQLTAELGQIGLTDHQRRLVEQLFLASNETATEAFSDLLGNDKGQIKELNELIKFGQSLGADIKFSPAMVRGLDYYTGIIIECQMEGAAGSVIGGGRYDSLLKQLTGETIPAVGLSFGIDRLVDYLDEQSSSSPGLFLCLLPETKEEALKWARELRSGGKTVETYLDSAVELGKQLKYADNRGYQTVLIPLEEEWRSGTIIEKNLDTGKQETVQRLEITNAKV